MKINILFTALMLLFLTACEYQSLDYAGEYINDVGAGGSLARFTVAGNYLYTVDFNTLKTFNIADEKNPQLIDEIPIGYTAETLFIYGNLLLLGTRSGVNIYDISEPAEPQFLASSVHIYSCDPVVAKDNYAYATLNSVRNCNGYTNELRVIDISNPSDPVVVDQYTMNGPQGLGISGNLLFVCDDRLKIYDITDPLNLQPVLEINIPAVDVIPIDTLLLVATEQGLAEYAITDDYQLTFLSSIY